MALRLLDGGRSDPIEFPLFDPILDRTGRRQLQRLITIVAATCGQVVAEEGEISRDLLVLADGVIKLYKDMPDGRRLIVAFRFPGDPVSLQRSDTPWPVTARAVSDCTLYRIAWEPLSHLARRYPAIDRALLDLAGNEIAGLQDRLVTLGRGTPEEKVASFVLEYCHSARTPSSLGREFYLPMRRSEIAEYLALTTESVSRVFSRFKRQRIIAMRRPRRIMVLNRPALEALALGGYAVADHGTRASELQSLRGSD